MQNNTRFKLPLAGVGATILAAIIAFVGIAPGVSSQNSENVVAVVNGEEIREGELVSELIEREGPQLLNILIRERILQQAADEAGVDVSTQRVEQELASVRGSFESEEQFARALEQSGHSISSLKRDIRLELTLHELVADQVSVSEEEIRAAYESYKEQLGGATFDQARVQLEEVVRQQKFNQASQAWLTEKVSESSIEILLDSDN